MNIFYIDQDPYKCAEQHTDKHVVKMILETAQMLSTAHHMLDEKCMSEEMRNSIYKKAFAHHPCTIWASASFENYTWLFYLFDALLSEYTYRFGKVHSSERLLDYLCEPPKNINRLGFTQPAQAMPDLYKMPFDSNFAYRLYYRHEKSHLFQWTKRERPTWL
jgi:hypothetical protein